MDYAFGLNQVCRQKDSTIRFLMKNNTNIQNDLPKNLPVINLKIKKRKKEGLKWITMQLKMTK